MSKKELLDALQKIKKEDLDEEQDHIDADELLLDYINDEEITKAFKSIRKWYS